MNDTETISTVDTISVTYDEKEEEYNVVIDATTDTPLSHIVFQVIAEIDDTDPIDLDPLGYAIDPDTLDQLIDQVEVGENTTLTVTFPFSGYRISVDDAGRMRITRDQ